jgi:hypothetical protein
VCSPSFTADPRRRRGENQKFQGTKEMGGEMESERGGRWKELGKCLGKEGNY